MHSIRLAHGLIMGLVAILVSSVTSVSVVKQAAFKVQSYASSGKPKGAESDNAIAFTSCPSDDYKTYGKVTAMTITPCERSGPDEPCTFVFRSNYTIELDFETSLDATDPRSSVIAYDEEGAYQYSGQSFNSCQYATCPIRANNPSSYVYHFRTLASPFCSLTFNVTQSITGPSLFCASTKINFQLS